MHIEERSVEGVIVLDVTGKMRSIRRL